MTGSGLWMSLGQEIQMPGSGWDRWDWCVSFLQNFIDTPEGLKPSSSRLQERRKMEEVCSWWWGCWWGWSALFTGRSVPQNPGRVLLHSRCLQGIDCPYMPGRLEVNWRLQNNLKQLMIPRFITELLGPSSSPPTTLRTLGPVPLTFTGSFAVAPCFSSAFFSACSSCLRSSQSLKVYQKLVGIS